MDSLLSDTRGVSPVVGKSLAAGIALLYVAGMTGLLLGGVIPGYETSAGDELADRVLATATGEIERSVPQSDGEATARTEVDLPATIRDTSYRLVLSGRTLALDHPADGIGATTRLALPESLAVRNGTIDSGAGLVVVVSGSDGGRTLTVREQR
jgi:hypothetical protein